MIQSEVSTPVSAPADARIMRCSVNEDKQYMQLDAGGNYQTRLRLGQGPVVENASTSAGGDVLPGYVAEPQILFLGEPACTELLSGDEPVDALDYLE